MLTVALLGNLVAAFMGGGVMGRMMADQPDSASTPAASRADGLDRKPKMAA
jgi:hypothetical protein